MWLIIRTIYANFITYPYLNPKTGLTSYTGDYYVIRTSYSRVKSVGCQIWRGSEGTYTRVKRTPRCSWIFYRLVSNALLAKYYVSYALFCYQYLLTLISLHFYIVDLMSFANIPRGMSNHASFRLSRMSWRSIFQCSELLRNIICNHVQLWWPVGSLLCIPYLLTLFALLTESVRSNAFYGLKCRRW